MSRANIIHGRGTFGVDFRPGTNAAAAAAPDAPTSDILPITAQGRLYNFFVVPTGNSNLELERPRRYVRTNRINDALGQDASQLALHPYVSGPLSEGVRNLILWNPHGWGDEELIRYTPGGDPVSSRMHFEQLADAQSEGLSWLSGTSGLTSLYASLYASSIHFLQYYGRPMPGVAHTGPGTLRNWATDLHTPAMTSLSYWRTNMNEALLGGMAGALFDATGLDKGARTPASDNDTLYYLAQALRTPGTYTSAEFPGHTGTFTNGRARRVYLEAVPRSSALYCDWVIGLYSWLARYRTMEASIGDSDYLQPADAAYLPIYLCHTVQDADDTGDPYQNALFLYNYSLARLLEGKAVACNLATFSTYGFSLSTLQAAAS